MSQFALRTFVFFFSLWVFLPSCKQKSSGERYINEEDTTYSEDIRSVSKRINNNPTDAELYYKRANTFFFENNYSEAVSDILHAIKLKPEQPLYHFKLGEYYMGGDTAYSLKAMEAYKQAIKLQPDYEEAYFRLGYVQLARQQYEDATMSFKKVVDLNAANSNAYFYMGILYKEKGDTAAALSMFEKTILYNPDHYDGNMQVGLLKLLKNDDIAVKFFDNAIRINEFSDEAYYSKALFMQNRSRFKDAANFYDRTIELNPGHRLAHYNRAFIDFLFENYTAAIELLTTLLDIDSQYEEAYLLRAECYLKNGQKQEALQDVTAFLKIKPDDEAAIALKKRIGL